MKKVKAFFKGQKGKKLLVIAMTIVVMAMSCVNCFAAEVSDTVSNADAITEGIESVFNEVSSIFSFENILAAIGVCIGSCAVLVLGWFGIRKIIRMIQTALKKGKISV